MFELHLGAKLHISSNSFLEGFFITGKAGQGRSTSVMQIVLELIRNQQSGLILDPYGDQSKHIQQMLKSEAAKAHVQFVDLEVDPQTVIHGLKNGQLFMVAGKRLEDGQRQTSEKGIVLLEACLPQLQKGQWLVVNDDAFSFLTDAIFEEYLCFREKGFHVVFSDAQFSQLSKKERQQFAQVVQNYIIYKPQNIDAVMLAEEKPQIDPERIKSIKQYHFQALLGDRLEYHASKWPLEKI